MGTRDRSRAIESARERRNDMVATGLCAGALSADGETVARAMPPKQFCSRGRLLFSLGFEPPGA